MNRFEKKFLSKVGDSWRAATPGFSLQAFSAGRKIADVQVGRVYDYYDFASLTKVLFSATSYMFQHDEKAFGVRDPISKWVPWFPEESPWRIYDLLSHAAGLTWWCPFYKKVFEQTDAKSSPEEAWSVFQGILRRKVLSDIKKQGIPAKRPRLPAIYSDLDLFTLGIALEAIAGASLYDIWTSTRERVGLRDTDFHRFNKPHFARKLYAPTETDAWRGKTLQGEVHDENAWSLKGVSAHAGLFGTLDDLSKWGLFLRSAMRGGSSKHFPSAATVKLFTKRAIPRSQGDWALCFMLPGKQNASCGKLFSPQSVGHTGFTGPSIWYDPKRDLLVTIVANRVHPTRENKTFPLVLRPQLHTWIAEEV